MTMPNIEELIAVLEATNQFHDNADICTADVIAALQTQAERIKDLEAEINIRASYGDEQTDFAIKLAAERDTLRAQLADIAASEPVAWADDRVVQGRIGAVHSSASKRYWEKSDFVDRKNAELLKHPLFTSTIPAQDVNAELVEALQCAKNSLVAFKLMPVPSNAWEDPDEANLEVVNAALSKYKGAK